LKNPRNSSILKKKIRKSTKDKLDSITEKHKQRRAIQSALDTVLVKEVSKTPFLKDYFRGRFQLNNGEYPHNLKF